MSNARLYRPTLSLTVLSASVLAVALLNRTIRHFRPCANLRHSLCIWWANSRVGAITTALIPEPASLLVLDEGDPRAARMGIRYESVFPVPVGDIAARSRDYSQCQFPAGAMNLRWRTSRSIGIPWDWIPVGCV
jgi:hypothetical protein